MNNISWRKKCGSGIGFSCEENNPILQNMIGLRDAVDFDLRNNILLFFIMTLNVQC
jgi:hypothetical protein